MADPELHYKSLDQGVASLRLGEYTKLQPTRHAPRVLRETAEGRYWGRFRSPLVANHYVGVTDIDFCAAAPHLFAVTASTRVIVYDPRTRSTTRQFTRFSDKAFGGSLRDDGRLLCAGGQAGIVQVFDCGSRSLLRQFKGHSMAVRATRFAADKLHVLSVSDDVTVRYWDVTQGKQVLRLDGHSDYIRSAAGSTAFAEVFATGAYDHTVRLWDTRTPKCTMTLEMEAPVERVCFLPGGAAIAACAGNEVCVWDVISGGTRLFSTKSHQKTITDVCAVSLPEATGAVAGVRVVTGGLDGYVKVHEMDQFQVTHSIKYPGPVMSVGLAPDGSTLAVGMADGTLNIKRNVRGETSDADAGPSEQEEARPRRKWLTAHNYKYFIRGQSEKAAEEAHVVLKQRRARLQPYDRMLRRFQHRDALDAALETRNPDTVDAVLAVLAQRGAFDSAIGGREAAQLVPLLAHLRKHIGDPRYSASLLQAAARVVDLYAGTLGQVPEVDSLFLQLRDEMAAEVRMQQKLMEVQGTLEPILARSYIATAGGA